MAAITCRGLDPPKTTTSPHSVPWTGNYIYTAILEASFHRRLDNLVLPLIPFPWSEQAHDVGFQRDAPYLVRPDGYDAAAFIRFAYAASSLCNSSPPHSGIYETLPRRRCHHRMLW